MKSVTTSAEQTSFGRDMAKRLGLGPEVRELKFGTTFTSNSDKSTALHTIKYDFKPASVDVSKMATVGVGPNNTMTVTVPHLDGAGIPHTVFKGSQRPYSKECVLIIDRTTGEITLEKLSSNIQLKKTRVEKSQPSLLNLPKDSSINSSSNRPITPIDMKRSSAHGRSNSRTKVTTSGKKKEPTAQLHPKPHQQSSPLRVSPYGKSPSNLLLPSNSLPIIGFGSDEELPPAPTSIQSSSSSSSSSKPTSINEKTSAPPAPVSRKNDVGALSDTSSSSSSSDSSDSDSELEIPSAPTNSNGHVNGTSSPLLMNMPDNLLNDDLQLSESESDSD